MEIFNFTRSVLSLDGTANVATLPRVNSLALDQFQTNWETVKSRMLTGGFFHTVCAFEGSFDSVVELPTSQQDEENQTKLKGKGQHAQYNHRVVNC